MQVGLGVFHFLKQAFRALIRFVDRLGVGVEQVAELLAGTQVKTLRVSGERFVFATLRVCRRSLDRCLQLIQGVSRYLPFVYVSIPQSGGIVKGKSLAA